METLLDLSRDEKNYINKFEIDNAPPTERTNS